MTYISPTLTQLDTTNYGMVLIYDQTLNADATTFDVSNIPQGYKHLLVVATLRAASGTGPRAIQMNFNNDSAANYDYQWVQVNNTTVSGTRTVATGAIATLLAAGADETANYFASNKAEILDYSNSSRFKVANTHAENMSTTAGNTFTRIAGGLWRSTSPINRIQVYDAVVSLLAGSRLTIYGLAGSPINITQAPGYELNYAEITSPVTVNGSSGSPTDVVSSDAMTYDGSRICVEFYTPNVDAATGQIISIALWDGSTDLGVISSIGGASGGLRESPVLVRRYLTPSVGSHTYRIRAYRTVADGTIQAGTGGTDTYFPAYIRITRA